MLEMKRAMVSLLVGLSILIATPNVALAQTLADLIKSLSSAVPVLSSLVPNIITLNNLVERDGLAYPKFSDTPFTGVTSGLHQIEFVEGKIAGPIKIFDKDGQLECKGFLNPKIKANYIKKYSLDDDVLDLNKLCSHDEIFEVRVGYWHFYLLGHLLLSGEFKNSLKEGRWEDFWGPEIVGFETFKEGKREGLSTFFHSKGKLSAKGEYKNDKREGRWDFYNEDGTRRLVPQINDKTKEVLDEGSGVYKGGKKISD